MTSPLLAFMGMGIHELMIVLLIFLLLFGSSKLPSLMRSLGASAREFKKGVNEGSDEELDEPTSAGVAQDKQE